MDSELTILILLALSFPFMAVIAIVLAVRQRGRILRLEEQVARLELAVRARGERPVTPYATDAIRDRPANDSGVARPVGPDAPPAASETPKADDHEAIPPAGPDAQPPQPAAAAMAATPPGRPPKVVSAGPRRSLEERLGARWSVWVGAVALIIGGLMLVRFSIEQGYFGPAARVALGALLGLALVGAGEWMRRRDMAAGRPQPVDDRPFAAPGVPAALTAAGAACVFGAIYAAYALYAFIGPATAFITLGLVAVLTMFSAALQGPALAALGLPAALAAPLLISSNQPRLWPLVGYIAAVVAAAYGLARIRRWRWLAIAAATGAWLWGAALVSSGFDAPLAAGAHVVIQLLLASAALAIQPHLGEADHAARNDWLAQLTLFAFAMLGVGCLDLDISAPSRVLLGGLTIGLLLATGLQTAAAAAATLFAGAMAAGALGNWPVLRLALSETPAIAPGGVGPEPLPESLTLYFAFAIIAGLAVSALSLRRLLRGPDLRPRVAAWYAAAAALTPLGVLAVVWMKTAHFAVSIPFALIATLLAGTGVAIVARLRQGPEADASHRRLATGAIASAAVAAIALGLTFALDKGMLTVAFALMAPAVAWIALRMDLVALRYAVGGVGLLLLGRIIANPGVAPEGAIGSTPILNWLLWGYGVPAFAFAAAAALLARQRRDRITALCESLAIIFSALFVIFEIRHALNGGDPFAATSSHLEAGLISVCALLFAMVLSRMNLRRADPVYRIGSLLMTLGSFAVIVIGLMWADNPLISGEPVTGSIAFNSLLPAYLAPAIVAGLLAMYCRAIWPRWRTLATAAIALALFTLWTLMQIRRYFQGPLIDMDRGAGEAEWLTYTVALLGIGVALLAWGLRRRRQIVRQASALFIITAVLKAFLSDMADLDGVWRALSFIGLGLVLIGVARAYQLLLFTPDPRSGPHTPDGAARPGDA